MKVGHKLLHPCELHADAHFEESKLGEVFYVRGVVASLGTERLSFEFGVFSCAATCILTQTNKYLLHRDKL